MQEIPSASVPAVAPTLPSVRWTPSLLSGIKRPGALSFQSPSSNAVVKNLWICIFPSPHAFVAWCVTACGILQSQFFACSDSPLVSMHRLGLFSNWTTVELPGLAFSFLCVKWPNKLLVPPLLFKTLYHWTARYSHRRSYFRPMLKGLVRLVI